MRLISLGLYAMLLVPAAGFAQVRHVVGPAPGLVCMSLKVTDAQAMDPSFVVPFHAAPSPTSPAIGRATAVVLARDPLVERNGFIQAVLFNGKEGWVAADALRPWTNPGKRPALRSVPHVGW